MKIIAAILAAILLSSCSGLMSDKRDTTLKSILYAYQNAMRWGRWNVVLSSRSLKAASSPVSAFENIRVAAYEVRQPPVVVEENKVIQVVEIQYIRKDEQRLYKLLDEQEWRYDIKQNLWLLYSPLPKF